MLGHAGKVERGSLSVDHANADMVASNSVQEQLSPLDNLALDAETKVCCPHCRE
jgi:hypothetical protein